MGDEVIKIENVLGAAFIKINTALRAVLLIMKEPLARKTHQFASNDIARYHALGVAESICNGCHSSFALFKKFFQWVGFCRAFCTNL